MPSAAGPVVVVIARPKRDQGPIALSTKLDVQAGRARASSDTKSLLPRQVQAQRATCPPGQEDEQWLEKPDLASESAAHRHRYDPDLVSRYPEQLGDPVPRFERSLRRCPHSHAAIRLGPDHGNVRLHGRMVHAGEAIGGLD